MKPFTALIIFILAGTIFIGFNALPTQSPTVTMTSDMYGAKTISTDSWGNKTECRTDVVGSGFISSCHQLPKE